MSKTGFEISKKELKGMTDWLDRIGVNTAEKTKDAMIDLAYDINTDAKRGSGVVTGRLINSIHVAHSRKVGWSYSDKEGNAYDGGFQLSIDMDEVFIGSNVEYAAAHNKYNSFLTNAYDKNIGNLEAKIQKRFK